MELTGARLVSLGHLGLHQRVSWEVVIVNFTVVFRFWANTGSIYVSEVSEKV